MMNAGQLRYSVTLQRRVDQQDAVGQVVHTYEDIADVLAAIEPLNGREAIAAQQIAAEVSTKITVRHRDDLNATSRVTHIARYAVPQVVEIYDVLAVMADAETGRTWLKLLATKRIAEGWRRGH